MSGFRMNLKLDRIRWQVNIWREKNLTLKNILIIFSPILILFLLSPYLSFRVVKYSANSKIYENIEDLPIGLKTGVVLIADLEEVDNQIKSVRIEKGIELLRKNRVENLIIVISEPSEQAAVQKILADKNAALDTSEIVLFNSSFEMCKSFAEENIDYIVFVSNKANLALSIYNCSSRKLLTNGLIAETKDEPLYGKMNLIKNYFKDVLKNNIDF